MNVKFVNMMMGLYRLEMSSVLSGTRTGRGPSRRDMEICDGLGQKGRMHIPDTYARPGTQAVEPA